ncbi:hypothetical protein PV326_008333, partial [Microctonus aethiopoides]
MCTKVKNQLTLSNNQKKIIVNNQWLNDDHIMLFNDLLKKCSDYEPSEPWRIQIPNSIKPVPQNKKHIQILYSLDQHWVCSYYDGGNLFIYDSLNKQGFREGHFEYLSRLFPSYRFDLRPVQFATVRQQPNFDD